MTAVVISDLTQTTLDGSGVFDVLMRATKAHLESEFSKNRIKGAEYSSVYLGSLQAVMNTSLEFLMQRQRIELEAQLMTQQVLVAQAEVEKAQAQVELARQQVLQSQVELEILTLNKDKIPAEIAHIQAQTALVTQQKVNLITEDTKNKAQTNLIVQQTANALVENSVLLAQECKLKAEYDLLILQKSRTSTETSLLVQKIATEKAQTTAMGVDTDSILGRQKGLYLAQTTGFTRDAEQKAAKLLVDTWNVRRTTDEGTVADGTNMLSDAVVGRAVNKMLQGVGA